MRTLWKLLLKRDKLRNFACALFSCFGIGPFGLLILSSFLSSPNSSSPPSSLWFLDRILFVILAVCICLIGKFSFHGSFCRIAKTFRRTREVWEHDGILALVKIFRAPCLRPRLNPHSWTGRHFCPCSCRHSRIISGITLCMLSRHGDTRGNESPQSVNCDRIYTLITAPGCGRVREWVSECVS